MAEISDTFTVDTTQGEAALSEVDATLRRIAASADAAKGEITQWVQFTRGKMGPYMKELGSHTAAMERLSKEWREYKARSKEAGDVAETAFQQHTHGAEESAKTTGKATKAVDDLSKKIAEMAKRADFNEMAAKSEKFRAESKRLADSQRTLTDITRKGREEQKAFSESLATTYNNAVQLARQMISAADAMYEFVSQGAEANVIAQNFSGNLAELRKATANTVDDTGLQKFDTWGKSLGFSEAQIEGVLRAATKLRAEGFGASTLDNATRLVNGEAEALRKLGLDIDTTSNAYAGMSEQQRKSAIAAEIAAEGVLVADDALKSQITEVDASKTAWDNLASELKQNLAFSFQKTQDGLKYTADSLSEVVRWLDGAQVSADEFALRLGRLTINEMKNGRAADNWAESQIKAARAFNRLAKEAQGQVGLGMQAAEAVEKRNITNALAEAERKRAEAAAKARKAEAEWLAQVHNAWGLHKGNVQLVTSSYRELRAELTLSLEALEQRAEDAVARGQAETERLKESIAKQAEGQFAVSEAPEFADLGLTAEAQAAKEKKMLAERAANWKTYGGMMASAWGSTVDSIISGSDNLRGEFAATMADLVDGVTAAILQAATLEGAWLAGNLPAALAIGLGVKVVTAALRALGGRGGRGGAGSGAAGTSNAISPSSVGLVGPQRATDREPGMSITINNLGVGNMTDKDVIKLGQTVARARDLGVRI